MSYIDMPKLCGIIDRQNYSNCLPLTEINVRADVRGLAAVVIAELNYSNATSHAIDCEFVFPMDDNSAINKLEVQMAERTIIAECRPRNEAEEIYMEAVRAGHESALLECEESATDIFRLLLGNLPSKETAKLLIHFVQPLERDPESTILTLNLPAVLNPRYIPSHVINSPIELEKLFQPSVHYVALSSISYEMKFRAKINLGVTGQIADIKSAHQDDQLDVQYDFDREGALVCLMSKFVPDHDFRLHITPANALRPIIFIEPGIAMSYGLSTTWLHYCIAAAWFEPNQLKKPTCIDKLPTNEYWLVIDRSGSMCGAKINQAKEALFLFVKSLPVGCKFNVIGFGYTYNCLFGTNVEYTEDTAKIAVDHSKTLEADMGGTEILQPLRHIYSLPLTESGTRRFVILLTDGGVSNTEEVIALTAIHADTTNVFAVGIGEGASTALVNGVARASGGLSAFVRNDSDRLQSKVISLLKAAESAVADNFKLEWNFTGGDLVSCMPALLPKAIYNGRSVCQFAIFERHAGIPVHVSAEVKVDINGSTEHFHIAECSESPVYADACDSLPLHMLAAKCRLLEIENATMKEHRSYELSNEAVSISVATGVLCKYTALVAVDRQKTACNADDSRCIVSIARPSLPDDRKYMAPGMCYLKEFGFVGGDNSLRRGPFSFKFRRPKFLGNIGRWFSFGGATAPPSERKMIKRASSKLSPFETLVSLQKVNGYWELTSELSKLIGKKPDQVRKIFCDCFQGLLSQAVSIPDDVLGTILAVTILRQKYVDKHDEWQLIHEKAVSYVNNSGIFANGQLDLVVIAFAEKANL